MRTSIQKLVKLLKEKKMTIAFAESITCGLIAHKIGSCSNTSKVFKGSIVCYDEETKKELLNINEEILKKYTAESIEVTVGLSKNLKQLVKADIHAAVTGLASEGGSESTLKPVGTVFFAVLYKNKIKTLKKRFNGTPLEIKSKACDQMFKFIISFLLK